MVHRTGGTGKEGGKGMRDARRAWRVTEQRESEREREVCASREDQEQGPAVEKERHFDIIRIFIVLRGMCPYEMTGMRPWPCRDAT